MITLIEICKTDDKRASYYLAQNKAQGLHIMQARNTYWSFVYTDTVYKKSNTEFKKISDGVYIFTN